MRAALLDAAHLEGFDRKVPSTAGLTGIIDNRKKVVVGFSCIEASDGLTLTVTDGFALFEANRVLEDPICSDNATILIDDDHSTWDGVKKCLHEIR